MNNKIQQKKPEILAPAGGSEQLIAAVRCGADAVYLGTDGFNARQNAKNFSDSELKDAVAYCHARNVAVHVALNTLIFDDEIKNLINKIEVIADCGADAVIVQDIAAAKAVRECCPEIHLHASTQMSIHNSDGVKEAIRLGFSRAVLARELTFDEIKTITAKSDIETEVFVHGALCTCISGACYLSAMLGGRSGNRGYCAQPCRLDFHNSHNREYALSLKDMSLVKYTKQLRDAGVASFKIEGRMKRPEYVAAAVTALRASLDGKEPDMDTLEKVFSRSGFTDGYISGKRNVSMYGYRRKQDVVSSTQILSSISSLYRCERQSVPVNMEITFESEKNTVLTVTDGINSITEYGAIPDKATNKPADKAYIDKFLSKTGGTPFFADNITAHINEPLVVPGAELNRMRRCALENLMSQRSITQPHTFIPYNINIHNRISASAYKIRLRFEKYEQIENYKYAEYIILPLDEIIKHKEYIRMPDCRLIAEIPPILWEKDSESLNDKLSCIKSLGIKDVMCSNIGAIPAAFATGMNIHGDFGLNITNSTALEEYSQMGLVDATLSFETGMNKIKALGASIKRGIIAYGYLPLMKLRMCPAQSASGCSVCDKKQYLTDRTNAKFRLLCKERKYTELLNSVPLYIGDKAMHNIDFVTLYFTVESGQTIKDVIQKFTHNEKYALPHTTGLYFRNVL